LISREVINNKYVCIFILALVLFFPTLANLVEHAASSTGIVLALAGFPMILYREMRPTVSREEKWLMWAFAGYFAVAFLSFAVNALTGDLVDPHLKYIEKAMRILFFVPVYFLLRRIRLPQWILWYGVSIGAIVAGIYALIDAGAFHGFQPGYRVSGGYHSIAFGDLSLVIGFMSFSGLGYFRERHAALVLIPITGLTLGMIACFLSGTRGAWIAMPTLLFVAFRQLDGYLKPWLRGLTVGIICLVCFAAYAIPETGIANRINAVFDETEAYFQGDIVGGAGERYEIWKAAWNIYREHPFLGVGPGGVKSEIQKMIAEGRVDPVIAGYKRSHSSYFSAMAECGLVGLVALLAVFVVPLRVAVSAIRQGGAGRDVAYAGLMLIAGFMHFGLTETILGRSVLASFYVVMLAVTLSMPAQYRVEKISGLQGLTA
jgi:O-antigen ligase